MKEKKRENVGKIWFFIALKTAFDKVNKNTLWKAIKESIRRGLI